MKELKLVSVSSLALILSTAGILAQSPGNEARRPNPVTPSAETTGARHSEASNAEGDAILASWVLTSSNNQMAMATLALQHAKSPEVKRFAQLMVDDHKRLAGQLKPYVDAAGKPNPTDRTRQEQTRKAGELGRESQPVDASTVRPNANATFDHLALIRELGAECLQSATRMHQENAGAGFDRFFVGMQVASHVHAVDMTEVFGRHATTELRSKLTECNRLLKTHLEQAKALCKQLDNAANSGADSNNGDRNGNRNGK